MTDKTSLAASIRNSAIVKNPVLFEAIGVAPVVAMATSVKTAIMLSVVSAAELVIIECFTSLALKKVKHQFRVMIYAVLGVLINLPLWMFFNTFAPNETANVSIFLPILAVNSLIALHCERVAVKSSVKDSFLDAVSASIGYILIIFIIAIIREVVGSGTFYGIKLNLPMQFKGLLLPFGAFLLLGFAAAFFKGMIKRKYPDETPEEAFNLSEISQSHYENLRVLLSEDFEQVSADPSKENPVEFFKGVVSPDSDKEEKKVKERKKAKKSLNKKEEKKPKTKKTAVKPLEKDNEKKERKEKYESEFDDLLSELELSKKPKEDTEISANSDGNGGDTE